MLKFFRSIRRRLLDSGSLRKYLVYAIGEILLVMAGILLALQVNNWNQKRIENTSISNAILELKENLIEDRVHLQTILKLRTEDYNAQKRVIKAFENGDAISESIQNDLGHVMIIRDFYSVKNGYDILKEIGVKKIQHSELRNLIVKYYDISIPTVYHQYDNDYTEFENVFLPYVRNYFKDWLFGEYGIPRDYQFVSNDNYFLTSLKINLINCQLTIGAINNCLSDANEIIEMIDKE